MDFQVITDMATALSLDALVSSHPIYIEVQHPNDISEIFDSISYQKVDIIIMLVSTELLQKKHIGEEYLTKESHCNVLLIIIFSGVFAVNLYIHLF